jgi:hypothetical protein
VIAAVDTGKLFELVWASALGGVVVAACFSLVLVSFTRAADCRRNDRSVAATAYGALTIAALVVFFGTVVFGISVIASK